MKHLRDKIIAAIIGFATIAVLLETGLRITGSFYPARKCVRANDSAEYHRIICYGDSFTYGLGVETDKTYPSQLENLLNSRAGKQCFAVTNRGLSGANSSQVLKNLSGDLEEIKPELVTFLIGMANNWNF